MYFYHAELNHSTLDMWQKLTKSKFSPKWQPNRFRLAVFLLQQSQRALQLYSGAYWWWDYSRGLILLNPTMHYT